jgi:hypothetical protein
MLEKIKAVLRRGGVEPNQLGFRAVASTTEREVVSMKPNGYTSDLTRC